MSDEPKTFACEGGCGTMLECVWDKPPQMAEPTWCKPANLDDRYCPACQGKRRLERQQSVVMQSSGITERERAKTFKNFRVTNETKAAYDLAKIGADGTQNLYIHGTPGSGKTHLALAIVNDCIDRGQGCAFDTVAHGLIAIRKRMQENEAESDILDGLMDTPVLVMDDFGAQKITDWSLSFLDTFVDQWYRHGRTGLILTSNYPLKWIASEISVRIASRLKEMCQLVELKTAKDARAL